MPHSVVVLDNCSTHHNQAFIDMIIATGAVLLFMPPYSPEFSPVSTTLQEWKGERGGEGGEGREGGRGRERRGEASYEAYIRLRRHFFLCSNTG
jgi:hypothetical protein